MRRVVITGIGIVCPIGNNASEVEASLRAGKSGISFQQDYADHGFRSQVAGIPNIDLAENIDKRQLRFMGPTAAYAYLAMEQAIADSGLEESDVSNERTGLVAGSGGPSTSNFFTAHNIVIEKGAPKRMGPFMVTRCMSSTVSACLATPFKIKGINYSITSACSTTLHCMGNGTEQIQMGKQDIVFAGGGEEVDWTLSCLFDAMGAMSSKYNDAPETAARAFDETRDGFVIGGGGGMVVLEELEHARARGAKIYAEIVGYGASSDGDNMVAPSGEGAVRCMHQALETVDGPIDYINTHGTSTPAGDIAELDAMRELFGEEVPPFSSSKSLCGHSLGAAGVQEAIHCLLMMEQDFMAGSANISELDPGAEGLSVLLETRENTPLNQVMSNNFGFGGTNASVVFQKL